MRKAEISSVFVILLITNTMRNQGAQGVNKKEIM